jgi:hypothetical protein
MLCTKYIDMNGYVEEFSCITMLITEIQNCCHLRQTTTCNSTDK